MFGKSVKILSIFGFDVKIDVSWLLILVLVVWSLAGAVFPGMYPGMPTWVYVTMGLLAALGLFASIVIHELSHSLMARQFGLPMTGITLFLFGGVAEMSEQPPSAKAELATAIAGPASSVVVAGAFLALAALSDLVGWGQAATGVLTWIGVINVVLVVFNLIPGFPLDGGRILRAILWQWKGDLRSATRTASRVGGGFGLVLIGLGFFSLLTGNAIGGLWYILIGMFIRGAAQQGYQQVIIRQMLAGEPVRRFMNDQPVTVSDDTRVETLVDDYVYKHHHKMYPVVEGDRLTGCVTTRDVKDLPREQWSQRSVGDVAHACNGQNTVSPDTDAMKALGMMSRSKNSRLLVVEEGRLLGVLTLKDLLDFLSLKLELESDEPSPRELQQIGQQIPTPTSTSESTS
jgi:Zn-dependent protease